MNAERAISVMPEPTRGERRKFVAVKNAQEPITHDAAQVLELSEMRDEVELLQRVVAKIKQFRSSIPNPK